MFSCALKVRRGDVVTFEGKVCVVEEILDDGSFFLMSITYQEIISYDYISQSIVNKVNHLQI